MNFYRTETMTRLRIGLTNDRSSDEENKPFYLFSEKSETYTMFNRLQTTKVTKLRHPKSMPTLIADHINVHIIKSIF